MPTSALIQADELMSRLSQGDRDATVRDGVLLLDVRWSLVGSDPTGYAEAHLPGAVFCDLDRDLAGAPGDEGRHPLPSEASMTATLRRLGISPGREVVVYDGGAGAPAARAWWCLRWAGHEAVRVLDGGLPAWRAVDGPLESGSVAPRPVEDVVARVGSMPVVTADDVLAGRAGTLVDARAAERFRGEVEPVDPVAGHIPGAASCPTTSLHGPDGRYLPPAELATVLRNALENAADGAVGEPADARPAVGGPATPARAPAAARATAYCGSGVTAAELVLAAHEAGLDLALYPGSWSHWVRDPARPVAVGP